MNTAFVLLFQLLFCPAFGGRRGEKPRIIRPPSPVSTIAGQTVLFVCLVEGNPSPKIQWRVSGGGGVSTDARYGTAIRVPRGSVFRMSNVLPTYSGSIITCTASNALGRVQHNAKLIVFNDETTAPDGFPQFLNSFSVIVAKKNSGVELECRTNGTPVPIITWYKDSVPIDMSDPRFNQLQQGNLKISNLVEEDEGKYECEATNDKGTILSSGDNLLVRENVEASLQLIAPSTKRFRPHFTNVPLQRQIVPPGGRLSLTCTAVGSPAPRVDWYHGTRRLVHEQMEQSAPGSARILLLDLSESINVTCVAESSMGRIYHEVQVVVKTLPQPPGQPALVDLGPTHVRIAFTPSPTAPIWRYILFWIDTVNYDKRMLHTMPDKAESYLYPNTVIQELPVGRVNNQPQANILLLTNETINVVKNIDGSINVLEATDSSAVSAQSFNKYPSIVASITQLKPYTNYTIWARAVGPDFDPSPAGLPRTFKTHEIAPSSPPTEVHAEAISNAAVTVQWNPPAEQNGRIRAYRIHYTDRTDLELAFWDTSIVDLESNRSPTLPTLSTNTSTDSRSSRSGTLFILSHLTANATYYIRVSAVNGKGEGPPSDTVVVIVRPGLLPAPAKFTAVAKSSSVIELNWKRVDELEQYSRKLQYYRIEYTPLSAIAATRESQRNGSFLYWTTPLESITSERVYTLNIEAHLNNTVITNLKPDQQYIFAISSVSNSGPGVKHAVFCTTNKFVPPPPRNLSAKALGPTELIVQWQSPLLDEGNQAKMPMSARIAYYELSWRPSTEDGGWILNEKHISSTWTAPSVGLSDNQGFDGQPISRRLVSAQTDSQLAGWYTARIGALQPSTFYIVHVRAVGPSGSGDRAVTPPVQTWDPPLPPPKNLRLTSQVFLSKAHPMMPQVSIKVSWEPPENATSGILAYRIKWRMLIGTSISQGSGNTNLISTKRRIRSVADKIDLSAERWLYWPDYPKGCETSNKLIPCRLQFDEVNTTETSWLSLPGQFLLSMTYEFRVAALTTVQAGHEAIQLIALEGSNPTGAPTGVQVKHETDSFILSWKPPDWSQRHGPFEAYEVQCDSKQPLRSLNITLDNSLVEWNGTQNISPNNLIAWPNGRIRVQSVWPLATVSQDSTCTIRARTKYGSGPWSSKVVVYAKQRTDVPAPPKKINAMALHGGQLRISWAMPLELIQTIAIQPGALNTSINLSRLVYRRFAIYVSPPGEKNWTRYLSNGPVTEFIVHDRDVSNYVGYLVRVSSVGKSGHEGTWSDEVPVRSAATSIQARLSNLTCHPMYVEQNHKWTMQLNWRISDQLLQLLAATRRLMHYRVNYTDAVIPNFRQSRESSVRALQPKSLVEHQIDNLDSNRIYWISVRPVLAPVADADPTHSIDIYGVPIHIRCSTPKKAYLKLEPPTIVQPNFTHPGQGIVTVTCTISTERYSPITLSLLASQIQPISSAISTLVKWTVREKFGSHGIQRYVVFLSEQEVRDIPESSDLRLRGLRLSPGTKYALAIRACVKADQDSFSLLVSEFASHTVCQQSMWVFPVATDLPPPAPPPSEFSQQAVGDPDAELWFNESPTSPFNHLPSDDATARGPGLPSLHSKRQSDSAIQFGLAEHHSLMDSATRDLPSSNIGPVDDRVKMANMTILITTICIGVLLFASGLLCLLFVVYRKCETDSIQRQPKHLSDEPRRRQWTGRSAHSLFGWIRLNKRTCRYRARSAFSFSELHGPPPGSGSVTANLPPYSSGVMLPYFSDAGATGFGDEGLGSVPRANGISGSHNDSIDPISSTPQFGSLRADMLRGNELARVNSAESANGIFYSSQNGALYPIDSNSLGHGHLDSPSLLSTYAIQPTCTTGLGGGSLKSVHTVGSKALSGLGLSCANPMVTGPQTKRIGYSHLIPVDQLIEHVQSLKADNGRLMAAEFESIDPGGQFTWEHSNRSANRPKNRYANVIAYDHSRVVLQSTSPLDPDSDYINANYLDGYRKQNAYIATQGPLPHTIVDFWRMVWDQRSAMIVSMTRLEERARVKCEQYWPTNTLTKTVAVTTPTPFSRSQSMSRRLLSPHVEHMKNPGSVKNNGFKLQPFAQDSSMVLAHSMSHHALPDDGVGKEAERCGWTDSATGLLGEAKYGDIFIGVIDVMELAYYTIRTFVLHKTGSQERREVRQLQFTAWPDHGVPNHPAPLLMFLRRVRAECPPDAGPIIVHCSAGVGRTGAFILLDILLEQMKHEKAVDVYGAVNRLRTQRNFMVQTEDQYAFVYDALVEAAASGNTELTVRQLAAHWSRLTKSDGISRAHKDDNNSSTGLELEFTQLVSQTHLTKFISSLPSSVGLLSPIDILSDHEDNRILPNTTNAQRVPPSGLSGPKMSASKMRVNQRKNRHDAFVPHDANRVALKAVRGVDGSDYINASYIDGYRSRAAYIATQSPLLATLDDFWRMIWETGSCLIVRLESSSQKGESPLIDVPVYWPTVQSARHGFLVIDPIGTYTMVTYVMREFRLTDTRDGATRTIRQFDATQTTDRLADLEPAVYSSIAHPTGPHTDMVSSNKCSSLSSGFRQLCQPLCEAMLEMVIQVHKTKDHFGMDGPITVHCNYGAGRSGVFLTIALVLERMRYEGVVDMFQTVKLLRWQRPGLVRTAYEYAFCYCCALEYIESFERYAN